MCTDIHHNDTRGITTAAHQSTNIKRTHYHEESQVLVVEFHRGSAHSYHPVPLTTHQELLLSESVGKAFHQLVKSNPEIFASPGNLLDPQ